MANPTALKFGHPESLIAESDCWALYLRPRQPTLGALVLVGKEPVAAFGELSATAFAELAVLSGRIETTLKRFVAYERINWLMLMMVDPDVHFHVIPRYAGTRTHFGVGFPDAGWPELPKLGEAVLLAPAQIAELAATLAAIWRES